MVQRALPEGGRAGAQPARPLFRKGHGGALEVLTWPSSRAAADECDTDVFVRGSACVRAREVVRLCGCLVYAGWERVRVGSRCAAGDGGRAGGEGRGHRSATPSQPRPPADPCLLGCSNNFAKPELWHTVADRLSGGFERQAWQSCYNPLFNINNEKVSPTATFSTRRPRDPNNTRNA